MVVVIVKHLRQRLTHSKCSTNMMPPVLLLRLKVSRLSTSKESKGLHSGTSCASCRLCDLTGRHIVSLDSSFSLSKLKGLS